MKNEDLILKAKELGIADPEALSYNELRKRVKEVEQFRALRAKAEEYGIDADGLSSDELAAKVAEAVELDKLLVQAEEAGIEITGDETPEELKAKLNAAKPAKGAVYTDKHGRKWRFSKKTPKQFRYNNVIKSVEDWIKDKEAMEEFIAGNLHWLERVED